MGLNFRFGESLHPLHVKKKKKKYHPMNWYLRSLHFFDYFGCKNPASVWLTNLAKSKWEKFSWKTQKSSTKSEECFQQQWPDHLWTNAPWCPPANPDKQAHHSAARRSSASSSCCWSANRPSTHDTQHIFLPPHTQVVVFRLTEGKYLLCHY